MENDSNKISIASIARENDELLKSTLGYTSKAARAELKISKIKRQRAKDIFQHKYTWHVGYDNRQIVRKKLNRTSKPASPVNDSRRNNNNYNLIGYHGKSPAARVELSNRIEINSIDSENQMSSLDDNLIQPVVRSMQSNAVNKEFGICMERGQPKIIFLVPEELASSIEIVKIKRDEGCRESDSPTSVEMLENAVESGRIDASESVACNDSESRVRTISSSALVPVTSSSTLRTKCQTTPGPRAACTSPRDQPTEPHNFCEQLNSTQDAAQDAEQPSGSVGPIRIGLTHRRIRNSPYHMPLPLQHDRPDNAVFNSTRRSYPSVKEENLSMNHTFDEPADVDGWERYRSSSNLPVGRPVINVPHNKQYRNSPNHGQRMYYFDGRSSTQAHPKVKKENNNTPSCNTLDKTNHHRGNQDVLRESNHRTGSEYEMDNRMYNRPAASANYHQFPSRSGPIRHKHTKLRRLSKAEYFRCKKYHLCWNCQGNSHLVRNCPFPVPHVYL